MFERSAAPGVEERPGAIARTPARVRVGVTRCARGAARRRGLRSSWRARVAVALLAATAGVARAADDPSALWHILHDQCVPRQVRFGTPLPCAIVDEPGGTVVLKDRRGASQFLLMPIARVSGIEDPAILAPDAPNYWAAAWRATRLVEALLDRDLPRESLSLAMNSSRFRTQNQLHIHVDCVSVAVRDALREHGPKIGTDWAAFPVPIAGASFRAVRVPTLVQPGATPFHLLARLPAARADMGGESLAVVGATFEGGEAGFYLLETRETGGERVQDHDCAVARAP